MYVYILYAYKWIYFLYITKFFIFQNISINVCILKTSNTQNKILYTGNNFFLKCLHVENYGTVGKKYLFWSFLIRNVDYLFL